METAKDGIFNARFKKYSRIKFRCDFALQDSSLMHKTFGAIGIFHRFFENLQNVLNSHGPLKKTELKIKIEAEKKL